MSDITVYKSGDPDKGTDATPKEKIAAEKVEAELTLKTQDRDPTCWCVDCARPATRWVRRVEFDMKSSKADPHPGITVVDTSKYSGPVPGFCPVHAVTGAKELAEAVYHDQPVFKWGLPAQRWFVCFTDGFREGGDIKQLKLH